MAQALSAIEERKVGATEAKCFRIILGEKSLGKKKLQNYALLNYIVNVLIYFSIT